MPSLEILDVSKNNLRSLPDEPGRLAQLRVLSLSNNHLTKLPGYLVHFASLRVLKVDQNPLEWPVSAVISVICNLRPNLTAVKRVWPI